MTKEKVEALIADYAVAKELLKTSRKELEKAKKEYMHNACNFKKGEKVQDKRGVVFFFEEVIELGMHEIEIYCAITTIKDGMPSEETHTIKLSNLFKVGE